VPQALKSELEISLAQVNAGTATGAA
jgi:hypothetical protein